MPDISFNNYQITIRICKEVISERNEGRYVLQAFSSGAEQPQDMAVPENLPLECRCGGGLDSHGS